MARRNDNRAEGSTGSHRGRRPGRIAQENERLRKRVREAQARRKRMVRREEREDRNRAKRERVSVIDPLTPRRLNREVDASMDVRYNPEIRGLKGQVRGSNHRSQTEIPAWYQQYQAQAREAEQRTAGYYQGAQANLNAAAQQGLGQTNQAMGQAQAQAQQQAATLGTTANTQGFDAGRQAASAGYAQNVGEAGAIGSIGAGAASNMAAQQLVGAQKMMEALGQERNERSKLQGEIRGVRRERGAASVDLRRELRGEERNWAAVAQEFGLDRKKLTADQINERKERRQRKREQAQGRREDRRDFRADRRDAKVDRRKDRKDFRADRRDERRRRQEEDRDFAADRSDEAHDRANSGSSGGSGGSRHQGRKTNVTPSEARENRVAWRKYVRALRSGKKPPSSADSFLVGAAGKYVYWEKRGDRGVTSPKQARILWRDYGIKVPVSPVSGHRSGRRNRNAPGIGGQGARPG